MKQDLCAILKTNPEAVRVFKIRRVTLGYSELHIVLHADVVINGTHMPASTNRGTPQMFEIVCYNALDYSIRPRNPHTLEGGPCVELHEQHELLDVKHLRQFMSAEAEEDSASPPPHMKLLVLDQSYVIAQRFEIEAVIEDANCLETNV